MKKMMILVAAVAMAAMANAAAVGWSLAGAASYKGSDYAVYVIGMNGVTSVDQITSLVATGADTSAYQFGAGTVSNTGLATTTAANSGKTITYSGSGTDNYQAFAILWNADGSAATVSSTVSIAMDNDSTAKNFTFGNQGTNLANNSFAVSTSDVPEPTSGLLLLLGVAGLALKRKRA